MIQRYLRTLALVWFIAPTVHAEDAALNKMTIVSLGDSITRAFNASHFFADSPEYSWATGYEQEDGFDSHLQHLKRIYADAEVKGYNFAVTGARAETLAAQVQSAIAKEPDYVTLLIGANDVCHWGGDYAHEKDQFITDVKNGLDNLIAARPKVKIIVSALPDVYRLWQLSKDDSSCQQAWDFLNLCKPLLSSSSSDDARLAFKRRWDDTNVAIGNLTAQYPNNVKYANAVATYEFTNDDVSHRDCFHPSIKGQKLLSDLTWQASWFAAFPQYVAHQ